MKLLNLESFIRLNGPCFNCAGKVTIVLEETRGNFQERQHNVYGVQNEIEIDINHPANPIRIRVDPVSNRYWIQNEGDLDRYGSGSEFSFTSKCKKCLTELQTNPVLFHRNTIERPIFYVHRTISALTLKREILMVNRYIVVNHHDTNTCQIEFPTDSGQESIEMKRLLSRLNHDKESMLEKIKTYLVLS